MCIDEMKMNKKRLHGVKFKFDTSSLNIRDCSVEDMKMYIASAVKKMFKDAGIYYNRIMWKPDRGDIFIQVLRNDFSLYDFSDDFREIYVDDGHKVFYAFTIGMQSVYLDRWDDITEEVAKLIEDGIIEDKDVFEIIKNK